MEIHLGIRDGIHWGSNRRSIGDCDLNGGDLAALLWRLNSHMIWVYHTVPDLYRPRIIVSSACFACNNHLPAQTAHIYVNVNKTKNPAACSDEYESCFHFHTSKCSNP
jgi:hypothetical protein